MNKTTHLFLQLVQIDSPSGHEEKISSFLQKWLKKNSFQFKIDKVGNIYATNNKPGKPLLLCAHMDTVQPGVGIKPVIMSGVIKSSGNTILGADNKVAIAAILTAIETTKSNQALELLFTVKEETGGGVEFFPFEWIKAKQGLIFDSAKPLGGIVLRSPYIYNFHVKLFGQAAHASLPQEGINAFTPAINILQQIKVGSLDDGETTINVGLIKGGTGINTIPDNIVISGEVRSYDKKLFKKHLDHIKDVFEKETKKVGVKLEFTLDGYCSGYAFFKSDTFIKQIEKILVDEGLKCEYYEHSGISDANVLIDHGILTINLTDGVKYPHTTKEEISEQNLMQLTSIIIKCIQAITTRRKTRGRYYVS